MARGKVGERTVFEVPGGSFNRTFRDVYGTVLHDIKNLSKTRTVAWNDTKGKTGMEKLKQIFNNIKHNWHAWRYGKKEEAAFMYKLGDSIKAFEDFVEKEKLDISDSHLRNEIKLLYGEVSEFTKGSSLREIRNEMKSVIFNAEEQSQSIGWDFRETFESFANEAFDVTSEDIKAVTDEFKATYPNADTEGWLTRMPIKKIPWKIRPLPTDYRWYWSTVSIRLKKRLSISTSVLSENFTLLTAIVCAC